MRPGFDPVLLVWPDRSKQVGSGGGDRTGGRTRSVKDKAFDAEASAPAARRQTETDERTEGEP